MFHPSRGGVRGGKDQFSWDNVKSDKDRENYLGHSLKAPVGRWQKGKDLLWYTREKGGTPMTAAEIDASEAEQRRAEIQRVKDEEEQLMREALGLAPKRAQRPTGHIDKKDAEQLFKREKAQEEVREGERVQGLGFGPSVHVEGAVQGERPAGTLEGEELPAPAHLGPVGTIAKIEDAAGSDVMLPPPPRGPPSAAALKEQRREERRRKKEERRAARKARKEERKRRKEERKRRREQETSSESDSDASHDSKKRRRRSRSMGRSEGDSSDRDENVDTERSLRVENKVKRGGERGEGYAEKPGDREHEVGRRENGFGRIASDRGTSPRKRGAERSKNRADGRRERSFAEQDGSGGRNGRTGETESRRDKQYSDKMVLVDDGRYRNVDEGTRHRNGERR